MKRIFSAFLAALLLLGTLSGCGAPAPAADGKLTVVATLFPYFDFARAIGGERVHATMLLAPGRESHSFEPTPADVIRLSEAKIFLYNGGEAEVWVDDVLEGLPENGQVRRRMMDFVPTLEEELVEGMEAEPEEDSDEIVYDEHIWTSPLNAQLLAEEVAAALSEADPEGADYYAERLTAYLAELSEIDETFRAVVAGGSHRTMVFGDRFPLLYFCKTYGLAYRAAFQGCSGDTEPSAKTLAYLIDKVKSEHIPVVYRMELSSGEISNAICESTGAKPLVFHSCHNVSSAEFESGISYLDLMRQNIEALKEGLK
ncbi:MAG: metal ABC transporter substrate-binding protein [Ruthenibacterium sp.]